MKTLLLLRHGKSSWKDDDLPDHDRPLKKRGRRDAPRLGKLIAQLALRPDLILSSTAARARETAWAVAEAAGYLGELRLGQELYMASPERLLGALRVVPDTVGRLLVVGHNPGLEELLERLTGRAEPMPTACLALVNLPVERWGDVDRSTRGLLVSVWRPSEL